MPLRLLRSISDTHMDEIIKQLPGGRSNVLSSEKRIELTRRINCAIDDYNQSAKKDADLKLAAKGWAEIERLANKIKSQIIKQQRYDHSMFSDKHIDFALEHIDCRDGFIDIWPELSS